MNKKDKRECLFKKVVMLKIIRKEKKPYKYKLNKEELCCKAEASACAPVESILFPKEDKKEGKQTW